MADTTRFYINGAWTAPLGTTRLKLINPATEAQSGEVAVANEADVDRAVQAAQLAFASYSQTSRAERLELLAGIIAIYERRQGEIAEAVTDELGAPTGFAHDTQAWIGLAHLRQAHESLKSYAFEHARGTTLVVREPAGVAALITPWNWPLNQIACKVAPALATGCTMVLKPSEMTPSNAVIFAEILHEAGVPAGVFNLVQGDGPTTGRALSTHPLVDLVSFTGSTRAGIDVARNGAASVKRVLQELGGKSSFIVLADADLAAAVASCTATVFGNTGQSCDSPTRLLVPHAMVEEAAQLAAAQAAACVIGDPSGPGVTMGPLVNQRQFDHVQAMIQAGIDGGARLVCGGTGRPAGITRGYFVRPTVFAGVDVSMPIARTEIFGPVVTVIGYGDEAEAVRIANDTEYGLAGYVHGRDMAAVRRVARGLRAGCILLNDPALDLAAPFGGYKQSGNGREYADFGFDDFTEIKGMVGYGAG